MGRKRAETHAHGTAGATRPGARRGRWRWLRRLFLLGGLLALAGAGALGGLFWYYTRDLPGLDKLRDYQPSQVVKVLDRRGSLIGELGSEKRTSVRLAEVPRVLVQAVIAAEDATFYDNPGLDVRGIARALWEHLSRGAGDGRRASGGSTITQQVVKRILLTPERSIRRKVQELVLAYRLNQTLSKDEILELYLNDIYYGHGRYGCEEAARYFFGKSVRDIDAGEAALLAGLPQSPERLSPFKSPEAAKKRQRYVLSRMVELGFLPREEGMALAAEPITVVRGEGLNLAPEIMTLVQAMSSDLGRAGGSVQAALDGDLQALARRALERGLEALDERQGYRGPLRVLKGKALAQKQAELTRQRGGSPPGTSRTHEALVTRTEEGAEGPRLRVDLGGLEAEVPLTAEARYARGKGALAERFPPGSLVRVRITGAAEPGTPLPAVLDQGPQGALVALDVASGDVLALVGGYGFRAGMFDRARSARRQPGSAFKPLVYGAALETRAFTAASVVNDAPEVYDLWKPVNYSRSFRGPIRLRSALAHSVNTVAIKLLSEVGLPAFKQFALRVGIERPVPDDIGLSLALGSFELTPLELAQAFLPFFNGGHRCQPRFFSRIGDRIEPESARVPALDPETAYVVVSMMKSVLEDGTAAGAAAALGRPAAGKTGTSNDARDAWFVGGTPDILAVVWIGFDDMRELGKGETGARAALPIWLEFMKAAHEGRPVRDFVQPPGIRVQAIDPRTGLLPAPGAQGVDEVFVQGTEPREVGGDGDGAERLLLGQ